ncbi:MAG: DMT family transporter [Calditrichia bacterium]
MKTSPKIYGLLVFMTILFGLSFIASQNALQGLGIYQLVFARNLLAFSFFLILMLWQRRFFPIQKKDWPAFLLLTLIEPVGYFIFETYGVKYTTPSVVSLMIATIPIYSMVFAFWILKEKTTRAGILGIVLSLLGVYFIISRQESSFLAPKPVLGSLFALGAAISAGLYNVLCRRLTQRYSATTITFYQTLVASLVFFPLAIWDPTRTEAPLLNYSVVGSLLYLALGCSLLAYFLLNYTLGKMETARVAVFANLIPVVTIFASFLIYSERLSLMQLSGALLVISGIFLTNRKTDTFAHDY